MAVLSDLVKTRVNYVVQESVLVIKDIFRRYPQIHLEVLDTLGEHMQQDEGHGIAQIRGPSKSSRPNCCSFVTDAALR